MIDGSSRNQESQQDGYRAFVNLLCKIERFMTSYYGFQPPSNAAAFLMDREYLSENLDCPVMNTPRAAVCVKEVTCEENGEPELLVGIYFEDKLIENILNEDPFERLNYKNLDAFCVLIEELSHFHLIFQRALQKREVSQLELEWQGEVDKFLFSAIMLLLQQGDPHLYQLKNVLYDKPSLADHKRYEIANKLAAQFWDEAILKGVGKTVCLTNGDFKEFMRINYHKPLQETVPFTSKKRHFY